MAKSAWGRTQQKKIRQYQKELLQENLKTLDQRTNTKKSVGKNIEDRAVDKK